MNTPLDIDALEKEIIREVRRYKSDDILRETMETALSEIQKGLAEKIGARNEEYYDAELDKLEVYSEEVLMRLYDDLKEKENELNDGRKKKQKAIPFGERQEARNRYRVEDERVLQGLERGLQLRSL